MSTTKYLLSTTAGYFLLYFAFIEETQGAVYVVKFLVWFMLFLMLFCLHPFMIKKFAEMPHDVIQWRRIVSGSVSWLMLFGLIWCGYTFTAVAQLVSMATASIIRATVADERKQNG